MAISHWFDSRICSALTNAAHVYKRVTCALDAFLSCGFLRAYRLTMAGVVPFHSGLHVPSGGPFTLVNRGGSNCWSLLHERRGSL